MDTIIDAKSTTVKSEKSDPSVLPPLLIIGILIALLGVWSFSTYAPAIAAEPVPANDYNQRVGYVEETDVPLELYQGAPVEHDTLPTPTLFILPTTQPTEPFQAPGDNMVTPSAPVVTMPAYPTIQPAPTFDAVSEAQRVELADKAARLEIERQFQALKIERERDALARQQQATAWGWFALVAAFAALFVVSAAIIHAYIISAVKAVKAKPAQKTAEPIESVDTVTALVEKAKDEWLDMVDWQTGKMPTATATTEALFGGQGSYRDWLRDAEKAELLKRVRGQWYVTDDFAARVKREIGNP